MQARLDKEDLRIELSVAALRKQTRQAVRKAADLEVSLGESVFQLLVPVPSAGRPPQASYLPPLCPCYVQSCSDAKSLEFSRLRLYSSLLSVNHQQHRCHFALLALPSATAVALQHLSDCLQRMV